MASLPYIGVTVPVPVSIIYRICGRPGPNDRPALPAGHPISWGLLTDGTALDGASYPFPVFSS